MKASEKLGGPHSYLKKNQSAPRPSEHPPVMGKKMSKCLGGIIGCKYYLLCARLSSIQYYYYLYCSVSHMSSPPVCMDSSFSTGEHPGFADDQDSDTEEVEYNDSDNKQQVCGCWYHLSLFSVRCHAVATAGYYYIFTAVGVHCCRPLRFFGGGAIVR